MSTTDQARPRAPRPTVALSVAVLVVVATVVAALLAVTAAIHLSTPRLPTGPPRDPPAPEAAPTAMAISTTRVSFQDFSVSLPEEPFSCGGEEPSPTPVFVQYVSCYAVVHKNYDGKSTAWGAQVGIGLLADSAGTQGDLAATSQAVFDAALGYSFKPSDHLRLSDEKAPAPWTDVNAPAGKVYLQQADANVSIRDLPTTYDRFSVVVAELADGQRVAFVADLPHDASRAVASALETSAYSVSIRS